MVSTNSTVDDKRLLIALEEFHCMDIKVIASYPLIDCYNLEGIYSRLYSLRALLFLEMRTGIFQGI